MSAGARVALRRPALEGRAAGLFLEPTILVDVPRDARCLREETFAPVAPVCVFDDEAEAIRRGQ